MANLFWHTLKEGSGPRLI